MNNKLCILIIVIISVFGCSKDETEMMDKETVILNEVFDLKIEEGVLFEEGNFCVKFIEIVEDNRCPEPVDCVLAGRVWIKLEIMEDGTASTIDLISEHSPLTDSLNKVMVIGAYEIEFMEVKPDASINGIADEDYIVSLQVREKIAPVCDKSAIIDNVVYDTINTENYNITTVEISGDCLYVTLGAAGCDNESWEANLIDSGGVAESSPEQRYVKLELLNDEICNAFFTQTFSFDLNPTQTSSDEILINLEGWDMPILYNY